MASVIFALCPIGLLITSYILLFSHRSGLAFHITTHMGFFCSAVATYLFLKNVKEAGTDRMRIFLIIGGAIYLLVSYAFCVSYFYRGNRMKDEVSFICLNIMRFVLFQNSKITVIGDVTALFEFQK